MNYRNGYLEQMEKEQEENGLYDELLHKIKYYLLIDDWINQTNMYEIFVELYIKKSTNISIVHRYNVSPATLTRYIKRFEHIAKVFLRHMDDFLEIDTI